jgi:hypothetical protein
MVENSVSYFLPISSSVERREDRIVPEKSLTPSLKEKCYVVACHGLSSF